MKYVFVAALALVALPALSQPGPMAVASFDAAVLPERLSVQNAEAVLAPSSDGLGRCLEVRFSTARETGIRLTPSETAWDWGAYAGLALDLENPGDQPMDLYLLIESRPVTGRPLRARRSVRLGAHERRTLPFFFARLNAGPYWGMRGIPVYGPVSKTGLRTDVANVAPSAVTLVGVQARDAGAGAVLRLDNLRVFPAGSPLGRLVPHPFIDALGQYIHADWPGKVTDEAGLVAFRDQEDAELDAAPGVAGRDSYGGWADGPKLEATGWFRTERIVGKWWLVTPEGHLFFSIGMNCVRPSSDTFVEGRGDWFAWIPEPETLLSEFLGYRDGTHSMAEAIDGRGRTFDFYAANLKRKLGDQYRRAFGDLACRRLQSWGFNTIGNWSDGMLLLESPLPFTVTASSGRVRRIEGGGGYWSKLIDVFDPAFPAQTDASIARAVEPFRANPLVIGYFVDNEMSWWGIAKGVLNSPPEQPARLAFIQDLEKQYGGLAALNQAWEASTPDWDALRLPYPANARCKADVDAFEYRFARRYFDTVAAALRKHAPKQLYLGCRFTLLYQSNAVFRACAEVVDVFSINAYVRQIRPDLFADLGKPVIIGEFHFGALDRGMFHQGLQAAANQAERAQMYAHYVESVAANPAFVGCHWFQYVDQPATGRPLDGENYSVGWVSVTDVPYPELVAAGRAVHERLYRLRYGGTP